MAAVDLRRAEQVAGLMRGPAGRVFARIAIAASLSETAPEEALARLLAAIEELEHLADRGWRSGDEHSLLNVGLTALPWISRLEPERTGDAFWRVLALRGRSTFSVWRSDQMRTADPVTAALLSHFDIEVAQQLLMPPDDNVTASDSGLTTNFFLPALTLIDADAASEALRSLAEGDAITSREIQVCREIHGMLTTSGRERWNRIQASRHGLRFE